MNFRFKRVATAVAWGLAFDSIAEMALAGLFGGCAGWRFGKGDDQEEVSESLDKAFSKWETILPPAIGVLGFVLGLMGRLPGTKEQ